MTPMSFAKLLVITLIAVLAATWLTIVRDTGSGLRGDGTLMFEDLATRVNDVARIKVTRTDGVSTLESVVKDGNGRSRSFMATLCRLKSFAPSPRVRHSCV